MNKEPQTVSQDGQDNSPGWFEKPGNVWLLIGALVVVCTLLGVADLFYENDHAHFELEKSFGFQAWFGFVVFVVVVFLGALLRLIIKRDEDYYDR